MGLAEFERRLERGVEGLFGRVFRSEVRPVELGRKLIRQMDDGRTVGVDGAVMAPNEFEIALSAVDTDQLRDLAPTLVAELAELGAEHAAEERYRLRGPVRVELVEDDGLRPGVVEVVARFRDPEPGEQRAELVLPAGQVVEIGSRPVSIGRQPDNGVVLADPNASRRHAEIRPTPTGHEVVDLGSTNGTKVNGATIGRHDLIDGDAITVGNTVLQYRRS